MKKMWKRIVATAMAACMTLGLATTAGAYQWEVESGLQGKMVQYVQDHENGNYGLYTVQMMEVGSEVTFSEPVDVSIYAEGEYGAYAPKLVESDVTSYIISDTTNTYVFTGEDGGMAFFRGIASQMAPITLVGDFEMGNATLKLSKPVVDIKVEALESTDWSGETATYYYMVYEVPVGTTVETKFGADYVMLTDIWDAEGKEIPYEDYAKICAEQFPDAEFDEDMGMCWLPLTLNEAGYYYVFRPEALACSLPVIHVVDEEPAAYTPRTADFSDMNWSKSFVEKVYGYGWMEGMGGGKFQPDGNLTIAQAITLAARLYSAQTNEPIPAAEGAWYQTYVDYCLSNNLLSNYYNEYFEGEEWLMARMNEKATRLDMVKILGGAVDLPGLSWSEEETVTVPDVNKDEMDGGWLVYDWYRNGIVAGDPGTGAFRPNDSIKRGEVAVILCNLLGL